jgi:tripartite-type tricarboxylate transporter receptor subunit TctC
MKKTSAALLCAFVCSLAVGAQAQPYPAKPVRMIAPYPPGRTGSRRVCWFWGGDGALPPGCWQDVYRATVMALIALLSFGASPSFAQPYPSKPVRMIAPYPPGGTSDLVARLVAQKLGDGLGRQIIVENRPGAAGNIGHEIAAKAPADGYTLLLTSGAAMVTNQFLYKKLGFDPYNDFAPISIVATAAPVLVVHPAIPARTVKDLVAIARARPDQLTFGSGGVGTTSHVVGEVFKSATGVKMLHVPYKGGGLAIIDLVAGQIATSFADMVPAVPQVKAGKLRALAVSSEQRSGTLPEVPTMAEAGVKANFPGQWWAVVAPRGTPPAVISRINSDIAQFMNTTEVKDRFSALGIFTAHTTPQGVHDAMKTGTKQMAEVVKAAGITPE